MRIDTLVDDMTQLALTLGRLRSIGHERHRLKHGAPLWQTS